MKIYTCIQYFKGCFKEKRVALLGPTACHMMPLPALLFDLIHISPIMRQTHGAKCRKGDRLSKYGRIKGHASSLTSVLILDKKKKNENSQASLLKNFSFFLTFTLICHSSFVFSFLLLASFSCISEPI